MHRIGVDLGGTKIEAVAADIVDGGACRVVSRRRIPTPRGTEGGGNRGEYERIVGAVASLVAEAEAAAAAGGHISLPPGGAPPVGVCAPGSLEPSSGRVENSNTRCLAGRPFGRDLEEAVGRPVRVENDANCFALAEASMGGGRGHRSVFGVIMGTGVGGGLVIGGSIHRGRSGAAGEWGHHALHPGGRPCYCGRRGCVEAYLSGPALEARWAELAGEAEGAGRGGGPAPAAGALAPPGAPLAEISASLDAAAAAGRPLPPHAERWRGELAADFGAGLANVISILDPDIVVIGGGVSNVGLLYGDGVRAVRRNSLRDPAAAPPGRPPTPVVRNMLGDSAGALGACML